MAAAVSGFLLVACLTKNLTKISGTNSESMKKKSALIPFLGLARGVKEAGDLFTRRKIFGDERRWCKRNKHTRTQRSTQVQAAQRLAALLLHVGTDVIMVASYKGVRQENPTGWWLEVEDEQILPWGDHLSSQL